MKAFYYGVDRYRGWQYVNGPGSETRPMLPSECIEEYVAFPDIDFTSDWSLDRLSATDLETIKQYAEVLAERWNMPVRTYFSKQKTYTPYRLGYNTVAGE